MLLTLLLDGPLTWSASQPAMITSRVVQVTISAITLLCSAIYDQASAQSTNQLGQSDIEALLIELRSSSNGDNKFFGDGSARALRKKLASLNKRTAPGPYTQTLMLLGNAEIDLGNLNTGIQHLEEAYEFIAQLKMPIGPRAKVVSSLGIAYLRLAETENCCALYSPESCIVPLQGAAIHTKRRGSEAAIK